MLIQNTRADERQPLGVQERLASLEQRVAALEREVDGLDRVGHPSVTGSAQPADDTSQAVPSGQVKVTPVDQVRHGQRAALRGVVERIRDEDEFVLRDETGAIDIYIGWQNEMPVCVDDRVTVHGVADDDTLPGRRPDVYARAIVLPDGTTQRLHLDE